MIIPISDVHIGDDKVDYTTLKYYLEKADYLILNGDIMNTATKSSVSFEYGTSPQDDLNKAIEIFEPYKHKILGVVEGNHEHRVAKEVGLSLTQLFCHQLGILDLYCDVGGYMFLNVGSKKVSYKVYFTHGYGGGRTVGAKSNKLSQLADGIDADIYIISHTHQPQWFSKNFLRPNDRKHKVQSMTRHFINTGAFLGYGGYAEKYNFTPSTIVTPVITLYGNNKEIEVNIKKEIV